MEHQFIWTGILFVWVGLISSFIYNEQDKDKKKPIFKVAAYLSAAISFNCAMLAIWL